MNKITITGRFVKDPDVRYGGANNTAVARLTLASQSRRKDESGKFKTDFIKCVAFGKTAETIEKYCTKGDMIIVMDGEFQNNNYTNKDGNTVYDYVVAINAFEFGSKAGDSNKSTASSNSAPASQSDDDFMNIPDDLDEELPFN